MQLSWPKVTLHFALHSVQKWRKRCIKPWHVEGWVKKEVVSPSTLCTLHKRKPPQKEISTITKACRGLRYRGYEGVRGESRSTRHTSYTMVCKKTKKKHIEEKSPKIDKVRAYLVDEHVSMYRKPTNHKVTCSNFMKAWSVWDHHNLKNKWKLFVNIIVGNCLWRSLAFQTPKNSIIKKCLNKERGFD